MPKSWETCDAVLVNLKRTSPASEKPSIDTDVEDEACADGAVVVLDAASGYSA